MHLQHPPSIKEIISPIIIIKPTLGYCWTTKYFCGRVVPRPSHPSATGDVFPIIYAVGCRASNNSSASSRSPLENGSSPSVVGSYLGSYIRHFGSLISDINIQSSPDKMVEFSLHMLIKMYYYVVLNFGSCVINRHTQMLRVDCISCSQGPAEPSLSVIYSSASRPSYKVYQCHLTPLPWFSNSHGY